MGGITVGYKTLIISIQFKQEKVGRSDSPLCNPTQSSSESLPVFSLQCFYRNGWNHSGVRNVNPFHSVLLPTGMGGELNPPPLELYAGGGFLDFQTYIIPKYLPSYPASVWSCISQGG